MKTHLLSLEEDKPNYYFYKYRPNNLKHSFSNTILSHRSIVHGITQSDTTLNIGDYPFFRLFWIYLLWFVTLGTEGLDLIGIVPCLNSAISTQWHRDDNRSDWQKYLQIRYRLFSSHHHVSVLIVVFAFVLQVSIPDHGLYIVT